MTLYDWPCCPLSFPPSRREAPCCSCSPPPPARSCGRCPSGSPEAPPATRWNSPPPEKRSNNHTVDSSAEAPCRTFVFLHRPSFSCSRSACPPLPWHPRILLGFPPWEPRAPPPDWTPAPLPAAQIPLHSPAVSALSLPADWRSLQSFSRNPLSGSQSRAQARLPIISDCKELINIWLLTHHLRTSWI